MIQEKEEQMKSIIKLWNNNFEKGVSIFQICLMVSMFVGYFLNNYPVIMFSMVSCLISYFEPTTARFSFKSKSKRKKK